LDLNGTKAFSRIEVKKETWSKEKGAWSRGLSLRGGGLVSEIEYAGKNALNLSKQKSIREERGISR